MLRGGGNQDGRPVLPEEFVLFDRQDPRDIEMMDGELPAEASHPLGRPEDPPEPMDAELTGDALEIHIAKICARVNKMLSIHLWETDMPGGKSDRAYNPHGLPKFWGLSNENFQP